MSTGDLFEVTRNFSLQSERLRYDFLQTDLTLCFTFADLATTKLELGCREAAERVLGRAEQGYATVLIYISKLEDLEHHRRVELRLGELRRTLDRLRRQLEKA